MLLISRKKCPFCYNKNLNLIYSLKYKNIKLSQFLRNYYNKRLPIKIIQNNYYNLLECLNCTGIFQEQIPNKNFSFNLYEKYIDSKESLKKKEDLYTEEFKKYFNEALLIKKIFNKKPKDVNILEFGSGWGFWSRFIKSCNFKVKAFEISNKRISYMQKNKISTIKNLKKYKKKFDFIYSDQTFEHIPNPKETIESASKLLKKNGHIFIAFPSSFLFKYKINKNYFPKKDCAHPLEHINLFNKKNINFMIKNTSLRIVNFKSVYGFSIRQIILDFKNLLFFNNVLLKKIN